MKVEQWKVDFTDIEDVCVLIRSFMLDEIQGHFNNLDENVQINLNKVKKSLTELFDALKMEKKNEKED